MTAAIATSEIFTFQETHKVRTVKQDNELWFVAKDVFASLGVYWAGARSLALIPNAWRLVVKFTTNLKNQHGEIGERTNDTHCINFKGLCKVAFRSNKPEADTFTNWAAEVIDTVMKTGRYIIGQPTPALPASAHLDLRDEIHRVSGGVRKTRSQLFNCLYRRYRVNSYLDIPAEQCANAIEYVRSLEGDYIPKAAPSPALALPDGQHYVVAKDGVVLYHKVLSKTVGKDAMPAVEAGGLALNSIEAQQLGVALHCAVRITNVWRSHISPMLHAVKSPIPAELGDNVSSLNFVANMLSSSLYGDGYPLSHGGKALSTR